MSDLDRFTAFLRRAAANYNEPPDVPAEAIWMGVEEGVGDTAASSRSTTDGLGAAGTPAGVGPTDDVPIIAPGYRAPPPPPRDAMWSRIEASWALRQAAASASDGPRPVSRRRPAWVGRRGTRGWVVALAAAASLVLWIALDRSPGPASSGDPDVAVIPATPVAQSEPVVPELATDPPMVDLAPDVETVVNPGDDIAVAAQPHALESMTTGGVAVGHGPGTTAGMRSEVFADLRTRGGEYLQNRHLDRTATLLTAFRIDQRTPASEMELASWASELLVDTRVFLDMPVSRTPLERALLEDLELVLLQISRLRPGAPDFEWQLARESMEWKGTLMRVRAASAAAEF